MNKDIKIKSVKQNRRLHANTNIMVAALVVLMLLIKLALKIQEPIKLKYWKIFCKLTVFKIHVLFCWAFHPASCKILMDLLMQNLLNLSIFLIKHFHNFLDIYASVITWPAPTHYLNQWWNIINSTCRNKLQWNFNRNSNIFTQENAFENMCKMASILSLPQCV